VPELSVIKSIEESEHRSGNASRAKSSDLAGIAGVTSEIAATYAALGSIRMDQLENILKIDGLCLRSKDRPPGPELSAHERARCGSA
jgi:hypothetical protein